jgi:dephospho-CoA kinase
MRKISIGLTGGIGAGKSLALSEFRRRGARAISLDEIARDVVAPGTPGRRGVMKAFGTADRAELGRRVFASAAQRRRLEKILHPLILTEMRRRMKAAKGLSVVDVPLLFEAGLAREFDATVLVTAPIGARIARVMKRDRLTRADVLRRMKAQWPQDKKRKLADVELANDSNAAVFKKKVAEYARAFQLMEAAQP